ncbi:hypothetical protein ACLMJK_009099 [Lecanora helva]
MSSLGRITNALSSAHNENTLALLNLNLDFSLYRYDAPPEFQALGANISELRRREAESGVPHRTARRLGALFEGVLPSVPELSRVYGQRVSEISDSQQQNPKAEPRGGPFADHLGADGTSIWAAATSRAISILLLGSILARMWSPPEATSLWVELVDRRRREVEETSTGDSPSEFALRQAAQQVITRSELADWDASTRAWLQTADDAKQLQQTQLMVIINNLDLPVSSNMNVYQSVIGSVNSALLSMEDLLKGVAQRVQSGAFLLGLSAWHIYPDMVVHGSTIQEIKQNDSLVPSGSIVTLGLESDAENSGGVYWSLPLAHLRFYGDPIQTSRSTVDDTSRVTVDELVYIALGALFNGWYETSRHSHKGLQWLHCLFAFFKRATNAANSRHDSTLSRVSSILEEQGWLRMLMIAAMDFATLSGRAKERAEKLIAVGHKRFKNVLEKDRGHTCPAFGLLEPSNLFPLLKSEEERIFFLRKWAQEKGLDGRECIIRYKLTPVKSLKRDSMSPFAFATAYPPTQSDYSPVGHHQRPTDQRQTFSQMRWIAYDWKLSATDQQHSDPKTLLNTLKFTKFSVCKCSHGQCSSSCLCAAFADGCLHECTCQGKASICSTNSSLGSRARLFKQQVASIEALGEMCIDEHPRSFIDRCRQHAKVKMKEPFLLQKDSKTSKSYAIYDFSEAAKYYQQSVSIREMPDALYDDIWDTYDRMWKGKPDVLVHLRDTPWGNQDNDHIGPVSLQFEFGDPELAALYHVVRRPLDKNRAKETSKVMPEEEVLNLLSMDFINASLLESFLASRKNDHIVSLQVLASIVSIYSDLPGATIAMRIALKPLHSSSFVKYSNRQRTSGTDLEHRQKSNSWINHLELAQKFACIAFCEFGVHNIDPTLLEHVFAMSSRNSIFVAAPLLDDPYENNYDVRIKRVVGNIGRAGIAMLIPPQAPRIRSLDPEMWEQIDHNPFDSIPTDSFYNTSLHLSFTQYTLPISTGTYGAQDTETFLLESLVSIHDRGKWVADLDVLGSCKSKMLHWCDPPRGCSHPKEQCMHDDLAIIDNWEELLDREKMSYVVRAYRNPQARLATAIISTRQEHHTVIISGDVCWSCVKAEFSEKFGESITYIQ